MKPGDCKRVIFRAGTIVPSWWFSACLDAPLPPVKRAVRRPYMVVVVFFRACYDMAANIFANVVVGK